jgi:zinc transport system substrate-binding protein
MQSTKQKNDHSSDHHEHSHGLDPHIWLSPELVLKQADTIAAELALLDSVNKEVYLKNCEAFKAEIRSCSKRFVPC